MSLFGASVLTIVSKLEDILAFDHFLQIKCDSVFKERKNVLGEPKVELYQKETL